MGLDGTRYDRNQPTLERTWNSVEIVREIIPGHVVVKSIAYPDLTRNYAVKTLLEHYRRRLGEA